MYCLIYKMLVFSRFAGFFFFTKFLYIISKSFIILLIILFDLYKDRYAYYSVVLGQNSSATRMDESGTIYGTILNNLKTLESF
jgi:hypothetical protein